MSITTRQQSHPSVADAAELELLPRLLEAVGREVASQAETSLERLGRRSSRPLATSHVLLPFGGGKDSTWTLAYLRLMQLLLLARTGRSFHLHLLIALHPGAPPGVFENIENTFRALGIETSDSVRVFTTSWGGEPVRLEPGSLRDDLVEIFRQEVLVSGHLSRGNGRETFCFTCNFLVMSAIARYVVAQRGELDFIVTGDSPAELTFYWKWVQKTASRFGLGKIVKDNAGFASLFGKLGEINDVYYRRLIGPDSVTGESPRAFPRLDRQSLRPPESFPIFGDTRYEYWTHRGFLRDFLGFELRPDAFNFTESDCRNPLLMAHLRGLLADFEGRGYPHGVREYTHFAGVLMKRKLYDREMIDSALAPYRDEAHVFYQREQAEGFAREHYHLSPSHLAGIVASPLIDGAARMSDFLRWRYPCDAAALEPLLKRYLRLFRASLRAQPDAAGDEVAQRTACAFLEPPGNQADLDRARELFENELGLSPQSLRCLALRTSGDPASEQRLVRLDDPHQLKVSNDPHHANNVISGR